MKKTITLFFSIFIGFTLVAQYASVNLDFDKSYIGENELLPVEINLLFTGSIPAYLDQVEISIYDAKGRDNKTSLYTANWKRPLENKENKYSLPVNYKLRSGQDYDIEILYFQPIKPIERDALIARLFEEATVFLTSQRSEDGKWDKNPGRLIHQLEELIEKELSIFRSSAPVADKTLSPTLALLMKKMEETADNETANENSKLEFQSLLSTEIELIVPEKLSRAIDRRYLDDLPTEKSKNGISVNVGYGGVFLNGSINEDLDYDTAPYAGLSFPLGNRAFAPKFLSNTYLGFGVLFNELQDADGQTYTGPIINRPIYGSVDFKLFQFVYLNIGANLLERDIRDKSELLIRPFVGISGKINLALSLER